MRRIRLLTFWLVGMLAGTPLFADVVTLQDGRQFSGLVESGNTQELHIKVGDQLLTIDIHQVQTIQFGVPLPPPSAAPPKAAALAPAAPEPAPAQPNTLILKDGMQVMGRWWSIDATDVHFLVNSELQHYPRQDVSGMTFGDATLPPLAAHSTPSSTTPAQRSASAAQTDRAPRLTRSPAPPPQQPPTQSPTLTRPSGDAPASAPSRGLSQPEEIGTVYFWNGKFLIPLELSQAVERKSRSTQYWEVPAPQSHVRLNEDSKLVFILRLPPGVDPASYGLFELETVNGSRRTQTRRGPRAGLATWPVHIEKNAESSLITYALTVSNLPDGEYSFSPSGSNDSYCFGVDP